MARPDGTIEINAYSGLSEGAFRSNRAPISVGHEQSIREQSGARTCADAGGFARLIALCCALALPVACRASLFNKPLTLCEVVQMMDNKAHSPRLIALPVGVRQRDDGEQVVVLSAHPPWRSLLVMVPKTPENELGVSRRNFGPLEWLEPSDTMELQLELEQRTERAMLPDIVRGAVWLVAQRNAFGIQNSLAIKDCTEPRSGIAWLPNETSSDPTDGTP